ncbi:MAG: type II toxin-antitoxin system VapC family toxin [Chitinivibrionia bacterium]|nr:type II toxin-antitoxin system VapC family toxin [Chitinivibrionia bacterium]
MKYLVDTHTLLWFFNGNTQLSQTAKQILSDEQYQKFVSIVSVWELAIKINLNKLKFPNNAKGFVKTIIENKFKLCDIKPEHIFNLERLENFHKDPFDRILTATAIFEGMKFITCDENIRQYPVECVW